jgi:hypothetical protein
MLLIIRWPQPLSVRGGRRDGKPGADAAKPACYGAALSSGSGAIEHGFIFSRDELLLANYTKVSTGCSVVPIVEFTWSMYTIDVVIFYVLLSTRYSYPSTPQLTAGH